MDIALILYTEHEFNAGSFGVRVAASAHSDLYSSVVAGECILRGPRHGCANEEVDEDPPGAGRQPGQGEGIPGQLLRPARRAPARLRPRRLQPAALASTPASTCCGPGCKELSRRKGDMRWYETLLAFEEYMAERMKPRVARGNPNAPANMDLWTAPLYYLLGIPIPMYTPLFAASRIAGWSAHYLETRYVNNEPILRPRAEYVGPEVHSSSHRRTSALPRGASYVVETYNPLPALIDFASSLRFEDLPANVVHETKRRAVDSIGDGAGRAGGRAAARALGIHERAPHRLRGRRLGLRRRGEAVAAGRDLPQLDDDALARLQRHLPGEGAGAPQRQLRPAVRALRLEARSPAAT